jgi:hypothetical protein
MWAVGPIVNVEPLTRLMRYTTTGPNPPEQTRSSSERPVPSKRYKLVPAWIVAVRWF